MSSESVRVSGLHGKYLGDRPCAHVIQSELDQCKQTLCQGFKQSLSIDFQGEGSPMAPPR